MTIEMQRITERAQLVELAKRWQLRPDWHEPDERDVYATPVVGQTFNNAGAWPEGEAHYTEHYVALAKYEGEDEGDGQGDLQEMVCVNLATLFAWATGYNDE